MEVLEWDSFLKGEIVPKQIKKPIIQYSIGPLTFSGLFDMSPIMKTGVTIIVGTSIILLCSAWISNYLIKKGEYERSEQVSLFTKIGLIMFGIGAVGFLFFKNPLWEMW